MAPCSPPSPSRNPEQGYHWLQEAHDGRDETASLFLVPIRSREHDGLAMRPDQPFKGNSELYREFARCDISCAGLDSFAREY